MCAYSKAFCCCWSCSLCMSRHFALVICAGEWDGRLPQYEPHPDNNSAELSQFHTVSPQSRLAEDSDRMPSPG